jgi:hypothetical protein
VKSQTSEGVYSNVLYADGRYACCSEDLEECMGLQGQICKHILVMVIGLVHAGEADASTLLSWVAKAAREPPASEEDTLAYTLLRYRGTQAGEVDWRPTETLPEDYYGF